MLRLIKIIKMFNLIGFIGFFSIMECVASEESAFEFGGFVKVSSAFSTKGTNGIDDALGLYNADLLFADDNKGTRFGISAKENADFCFL